MKTSRLTDEQMVAIVQEREGAPVAEVARKDGITDQTLYLWRRRFGGIARRPSRIHCRE